jgi:hypothetical protein
VPRGDGVSPRLGQASTIARLPREPAARSEGEGPMTKLTFVYLAASALAVATTRAADVAPSFTAAGELERPADYREWVYLTSGLDMFYGPAANRGSANRPPLFDNVFVTRTAYAEFQRSGTWPDKTMFILEVRRAQHAASIDTTGQSQGDLVAIEAAVKDVQRFGADAASNGWGYFALDGEGGLRARAAPLPTSATCYACHATNTAVDNTFVQFYPTLFEIAKRLGTVKPTYDPARKL